MSKFISLHSFRRGTGKTSLSANLAVLMAAGGQRVGLVDTDLQSPALHTLFCLGELGHTLNDYLWGKCHIEQAALDLTPRLSVVPPGQLYLVPASPITSGVARVLRDRYDVNLLNDGLEQLAETLKLDVLIADTHAGLSEETLTAIAAADVLLILLRIDQQDYQGTSILVDVARQLVPKVLLIVNQIPSGYDLAAIQAQMEGTYQCKVAAMLPHTQDVMVLASADLFVLCYPAHVLTDKLAQLASQLVPHRPA